MKQLALAFAATVSLAPSTGFCHPHVLFSARFEAVAGPDGKLAELRNDRLFDEVFSSSIPLDFDKTGDFQLDAGELKAVGETVCKSMAKYDHYTCLIQDGAKIPIDKPLPIHVTYTDNLPQMRFSVIVHGAPAVPTGVGYRLPDVH